MLTLVLTLIAWGAFCYIAGIATVLAWAYFSIMGSTKKALKL